MPISRSGGCIPDVVVFFVPGTPLIWNSKDMCGFFNGSDQSPIGSDIGSESPKVFPQLTSFGARFVSLSPLCCRLILVLVLTFVGGGQQSTALAVSLFFQKQIT